jgi:hypothetical protein
MESGLKVRLRMTSSLPEGYGRGRSRKMTRLLSGITRKEALITSDPTQSASKERIIRYGLASRIPPYWIGRRMRSGSRIRGGMESWLRAAGSLSPAGFQDSLTCIPVARLGEATISSRSSRRSTYANSPHPRGPRQTSQIHHHAEIATRKTP